MTQPAREAAEKRGKPSLARGAFCFGGRVLPRLTGVMSHISAPHAIGGSAPPRPHRVRRRLERRAIKRRCERCAKTVAFLFHYRRNGPKGSPFVPQSAPVVAGAATVRHAVRKARWIAAIG